VSSDVVLVDYRLPGVDGLTRCRRIRSEPPAPGDVPEISPPLLDAAGQQLDAGDLPLLKIPVLAP
jgi:CheY-like chemotaxis protein